MKFSTGMLKKNVYTNNTISGTIDFKEFISDEILDVEPCVVNGNYSILDNDTKYVFDIQIKTAIYMPCAISLEPVKVPMEFPLMLIFANTEFDDDVYLIEGQTIDLKEAIWGNIMIEKPMRVVKDGMTFDEEIVTIDKEENNPFKDLLKLKK